MMLRLYALLIVAVLAGCAPAPVKMTASDRQAAKAASIEPAIEKPAEPYYLGPGAGGGLMFGALGALATEGARADARSSLVAFLAKNDVSIERIVQQEFGAVLRASGKIAVLDQPQAGAATIRIAIRQYGLSIPHGLSSNLVPILYLECEMKDASGKSIWKAADRVLTLGNPVDAAPGEALRNDPRAIEKAWRAAARHISANIVKEL